MLFVVAATKNYKTGDFMERKKVEMLRIKDVQMFQACKIDVFLCKIEF